MNIKAHSIALPPKPLTDPSFEYRHSWNTDLAETFRRAREERKAALKPIHVVIDNARSA